MKYVLKEKLRWCAKGLNVEDKGVNGYEWLLIEGRTTRLIGVVITDMENIELRVEGFLLLFSDLYLRAEGITEFYLSYIKCEIFINPSGDVKRQINKCLNLKLSGHATDRNLVAMWHIHGFKSQWLNRNS